MNSKESTAESGEVLVFGGGRVFTVGLLVKLELSEHLHAE